MSIEALPPLKSVAYLVALRDQHTRIFNEFEISYRSLRKFHPGLQVFVYYDNLVPDEIRYFEELDEVRAVPIGVDGTGRFKENRYFEKHGWVFPELSVLAAKIDALLLTPGDTLFLDTDTEVRSSLDDCLRSDKPWMHVAEERFADRENLQKLLTAIRWETFGWQGDLDRLAVYNSGAVYVPQDQKIHLYKAKELLWCLTQLPPEERGDNRLDEQLAISVALQEAVDYELPVVAPRVYHFWEEKYEKRGDWYAQTHGPGVKSPVAYS